MLDYPDAPPNPMLGVVSLGFVILAIYGFVRLSSEGEARFSACKKAISIGISGIVIVTLLESLILWNWFLQSVPVNYIVIWIGNMIMALPIIIILLIDLGVQWYILSK